MTSLEYFKNKVKIFFEKRGSGHYMYTQEEMRSFIKQADDIMCNTITFNKTWDMERCKTPYTITWDWDKSMNGDEEWTFMLNRMDYLDSLFHAYQISKDWKYMDKGISIVDDWILKHQILEKKDSTRTLDMAIRIMNMFLFLAHAMDQKDIEDTLLSRWLESIDKQLIYMRENYLEKYRLSNWGSIQTAVILILIPFIEEEYLENEIYNFACIEYKKQIPLQFLEDGNFWEQSTMYHVEVVRYALKHIYFQSIHELEVDIEEVTIIKKAVLALALQVTPSGWIEPYGDSDTVPIFELMNTATAILQMKEIAGLTSDKCDADFYYVYGQSLSNELLDIKKQRVELSKIFDGESSGMFCVRSSWNKNANYTLFLNGSLGSGHGHSDNLHVSIYHKGSPFMVDNGRFTYREDDARRVQLKSMHAHNTIIVDEEPASIPESSWGYSMFGEVGVNYYKHEKDIHYYEGSFIESRGKYTSIRKLLILDEGVWFVNDSIYAKGSRMFTQRFHLHPNIIVKEVGLQIELQSTESTLVCYATEKPKIEKGLYSSAYNEVVSQDALVFQKEFSGKGNNIVIFGDKEVEINCIPVFRDNGKIVSENLANGYKIRLKDKQYIVVFVHRELFDGRKLLTCEGFDIYGKCTVIEIKGESSKVHRLRT